MIFRRGTIFIRVKVDDGTAKVPELIEPGDENEAEGEGENQEPSPEAGKEEESKEESKEIPDQAPAQKGKKEKEKTKFKVMAVHEDLVEKEVFYQKYDLNAQLEGPKHSPPMVEKLEKPSQEKKGKQEKQTEKV